MALRENFPNEPVKITLPRIYDPRGSLTVVEEQNQIPFDIARVYWIYDVPGGEERGAHSHRKLQQLMMAVSGSLDIEVTDGFTTKVFTLNKPFEGLYLPPGIWRRMFNFSSGSCLLSIVSLPYDEKEYIRDYDEFIENARKRGPIITQE
ncbi:MAG: FdtA/QdtA family cupin domain-containing protein [Duncaniella sp.]|nr:FdtA/QdtA family cupin domain-containing protein [Duncaniella sp.]